MSSKARQDTLPGCSYIIWQSPDEFCFTTDAVLLAAFPHQVRNARVLDLGCGTGAIGLLAVAKGAKYVLGIDVRESVLELLKASISTNSLTEQMQALRLNVRDIRGAIQSESFDLVYANPPYRIGGKRRQVGRSACHEEEATLEDFFAAASYSVKYRGRFALVQLPERLVEAVTLGKKYALELKRLQFVHGTLNKPAWIFLAEFVKGAHPGLEVLPPLVVRELDGSYSAEALARYRVEGSAQSARVEGCGETRVEGLRGTRNEGLRGTRNEGLRGTRNEE